MENIVKNVDSLSSADRQAMEHLLGRSLGSHQQLVIQVRTPPAENLPTAETTLDNGLPHWCSVYAGLTDLEVAELEQIVLERSNFTRTDE